jgi:hypothetical protein
MPWWAVPDVAQTFTPPYAGMKVWSGQARAAAISG